jgi:peptidoglycan hydrolase-like protein with peptidoglycan-binding domain
MMQTRLTVLAAALGLTLATGVYAQQQPPSETPTTPSASAGAQAQAQDSQTVRQVQQQLKDQGHDIAVDGQMGPQTQAALKEFQKKQGLEASGELDAGTMSALGVTGSADAGSSTQSPSTQSTPTEQRPGTMPSR